MLNVRIFKGGCRGREAVKFGAVGFRHVFSDIVSFPIQINPKSSFTKGKNMKEVYF